MKIGRLDSDSAHTYHLIELDLNSQFAPFHMQERWAYLHSHPCGTVHIRNFLSLRSVLAFTRSTCNPNKSNLEEWFRVGSFNLCKPMNIKKFSSRTLHNAHINEQECNFIWCFPSLFFQHCALADMRVHFTQFFKFFNLMGI